MSGRLAWIICGHMASSACAASFTPSEVLRVWRQARVGSTASVLDVSRYHLQLLFVDSTNQHARVAEGVLERVAEWADAGWWLYPHAATIGSDLDGLGPLPATLAACAELDLCAVRSGAPGASLCREDLDSYDLIICLDDEVRLAILRWLRDDLHEHDVSYYECGRLCLLSDFISLETDAVARGAPPVLQRSLMNRVAPFVARAPLAGGLAATRAWPQPGGPSLTLDLDGVARAAPDGSWRAAEAGILLACAGLTRFCKETINAGFVTAYGALLAEMFHAPEHADAVWADAEPRVRTHSFTGALTPGEREKLFDLHIAALARQRDSM